VKYTALGCYIFAGGFTVGVQKHFKILGHLEDGDFGVPTARLNWPKLPIYTDPATWPLRELRGEVDFMYCNPPCAPWSATGRRATQGYDSWRTDPRVECVRKAYGAFEAIRPHVWVWESVPGAYNAGRELVDALTASAAKLGYSATHFLTDAQLHGLPQRRQRFHLVLHDVELNFPAPTGPIIPVGRALRGVNPKWWPTHGKLMTRLIKHTRPGDGLRETYDRLYPKPRKNAKGQAIGRPTWMNFRLEADKPSPTLIGAGHAVHPTKDRIIAPEEQAALCAYPKDFKWQGRGGALYAQICRAVTPVIGNYLGGVAKEGVRRNKKLRTPQLFTVDYRKLRNTTAGAR
jgi:site-specific DNA-cytosine methylase